MRVLIAVLWLTAITLLIGVMRLPGSGLDIYFKDTYVVVKKTTLLLILVTAMVALLEFTFKRFRPRQ
jgi:hypothetical protein